MVENILSKIFTVLVAAGLFIWPGMGYALAQPNTNTMMVIDASRSMWGQIDGVNKVVSLRNALEATFARYEGRTNLGLVAYGHRKDAGCNDIEVIHPLGALVADEYNAEINKIRPKGSTPISNALQIAADASGQPQARASIILISDGLDNCRGNPCEIARSLKETRPALSIHVIGFDKAKKEELAALSCVAQATGGTYASATSEKELKVALDNAMDLSVAMPTATIGTLAPVMRDTDVGTSSTGTQGATSSYSWRPVTDGAGGAISSGEEISRANMKEINQAVAQAESNVQKTTVVPLTGPKTPVTLVARLTEGGEQISSGIVWRIFETKPDRNGKYQLLSTHRDPVPTAVLTPGEYLVNAAYGRAHLTKKLKVAKGAPMAEQFVMNAGGLRLDAMLANGQKISPDNVSYIIYSDEQDQFGNREKILTNARTGLVYRLNAGIYHVMSKYGNANAVVEADVTVEPGKLTEATINHQAGRVTFKLVLQPGGDALANTQWQIMNEAGDVVKSSAGALPSHILAAGQYSVVAKHSGRQYQMPFAVGSGEVKQVEVVIQ